MTISNMVLCNTDGSKSFFRVLRKRIDFAEFVGKLMAEMFFHEHSTYELELSYKNTPQETLVK